MKTCKAKKAKLTTSGLKRMRDMETLDKITHSVVDFLTETYPDLKGNEMLYITGCLYNAVGLSLYETKPIPKEWILEGYDLLKECMRADLDTAEKKE